MPASTANLTFSPSVGSTVWVITPDSGIKEGQVVQYKVLASHDTTEYSIVVNTNDGAGARTLDLEDVFTTLHDAIVAYEIKLS